MAFVTGAASTYTVTTTGRAGGFHPVERGTLPAGITFTNNSNGTATLSGTADPGTAGPIR